MAATEADAVGDAGAGESEGETEGGESEGEAVAAVAGDDVVTAPVGVELGEPHAASTEVIKTSHRIAEPLIASFASPNGPTRSALRDSPTWSGGRDLNSRSPGPKPGAFPS